MPQIAQISLLFLAHEYKYATDRTDLTQMLSKRNWNALLSPGIERCSVYPD